MIARSRRHLRTPAAGQKALRSRFLYPRPAVGIFRRRCGCSCRGRRSRQAPRTQETVHLRDSFQRGTKIIPDRQTSIAAVCTSGMHLHASSPCCEGRRTAWEKIRPWSGQVFPHMLRIDDEAIEHIGHQRRHVIEQNTAIGTMMRSTEEWVMSRSCHRLTFSIDASAFPRKTRDNPATLSQ